MYSVRLMERAAVCTVASRNHLARARVLARSVREHHPDLSVHVLLADRIEDRFDPSKEPFDLVPLEALRLPDLPSMAFRYSGLEFSAALKPFLLRHLLDAGVHRALYLDSDILVTGSLDGLFDRLDAKSILLTPHITAPLFDGRGPDEVTILLAGTINSGCVGVRDAPVARRMLDWWADRLATRCLNRPADGLVVDQRWLDLVPGFFPDCDAAGDPGWNVAYWNLHERSVTLAPTPRAGGRPLAFFHFSGYDPARPAEVSRHQNRHTMDSIGEAAALFDRYRALLLSAGHEEIRRWGRAFDRFHDGVAVAPVLRDIHRELGSAADRLGDPFRAFLPWLRESPDGFAGTNLVGQLWNRREAMPGAPADRGAFAEWLQRDGWARLDLDPALVPRARPGAGPPPERARAVNLWTDLLSPQFCKACLLARLLERLGLRGRAGRAAEAVFAKSAAPSPVEPAQAYRGRLPQGVARAVRRLLGVCEKHERIERILGRPKRVEPARPAPRTPLGINLAGHFTLTHGLGEATRLLARALEAASIPHVRINEETDLPESSLLRTTERFAKANPFSVNVVQVNPDRVPIFARARGGSFFAGRYNVGLWMWEQPVFPREWRHSFGYFDEIWAATAFAVDAVAQSSPVPVVRVPIPMVRQEGPRRPRAHFGLREDEFIVLFIFDAKSVFERKNPFALIEAFRSALGDRRDARLVIKWATSPLEPAPQERLRAEGRDPRILLIDRPLSRAEIDSLHAAADVYASLHRAEGFGLTMAEAMLAGRPVIATAYSGNMDFMTPATSLLVRYGLVTLDRDVGPYKRGCEWADPDVAHAAELLRWTYEHREEARRIGEAGRAHIESRFSPAAVGRHVAARLAAIGERLGYARS